MALGNNTKIYFESLERETKENLTPPFWKLPDIDSIRKTCLPGFGTLATPFPKGASEKDFRNHTLMLKSGYHLPLQIYIPPQLDVNKLLPTLIYFYGGGFCLNLNNFQRGVCATLAKQANCQVIMLDYPLAPEYTAKEIVDISYEAIIYLYQHNKEFNIDPVNFMLAGCSSGGTIAALLTNRSLQDSRIKIAQQILFSPLVDLSLKTHKNNPYLDYQKQDIMLVDEALEYFVSTFVRNGIDPLDQNISPLNSKNWKELPETLIIVGEYDALRGDGVRYSQVLLIAGCEVEFITCQGQTHNFLTCRKALNDGEDPAILAANVLKKKLLKQTENNTLCVKQVGL